MDAFEKINMNLAAENAKLRAEVETLSDTVNDIGLNYERLLSDAKTEAQRYKQTLATTLAFLESLAKGYTDEFAQRCIQHVAQIRTVAANPRQ